jgi:hypothetical protein
MIKIKLIEENGFLTPERQLTLEENSTVTSILFNGIDAIYYQGDEPIVENLTENVNNNE